MGRVLAGGGPTAERLDTLEGMGWLAQKRGDVDRARATYEEMLELSRKSNDGGTVATALNSLGTLAASTGDNAQAKRYLEENLSVLERMGRRIPNDAKQTSRVQPAGAAGAQRG